MTQPAATAAATAVPCDCAFQPIREGLRFVEDQATGKLWFVARDVCERLGTNPKDIPAILDWRDEYRPLASLRGIATIEDVNKLDGLRKDTRMLSEPGLYRLVFRSRKPEAVRFQDWVFDEVLPAIHEHGCYFTPLTVEKMLDDPDYVIELALKIKADREERERQQEQQNRNKLWMDGGEDGLIIDV